MKRLRYLGIIGWIACIISSATFNSCTQTNSKNEKADSIKLRENIPSSPMLTPAESIKKMHVEPGFTVKLVASEPLVMSPVAINFDDSGRIWAVEMQGYMNDTLGTGEDIPNGKIVILSDSNNDGQMDQRKIFLDSLVLPRAICFVDKGILVAEPPRLWYYDIVKDKPVHKTLVDSLYATGGNVEHQPNGLLRAMDNWIYSAKSATRYKKQGSKWLKETTHFRGQWGITQDDYGHLLYNTNSDNLLGDYFSPGIGASNDLQHTVAGYNENIVENNKVYPVRVTPGVNRGYQKGVLDDNLKLVNFTAACSPLFFNNYSFGKEFYGNVFVAEPSANLIKRNIINENGYKISGEQAYKGKEFLASEDERFRPVSMNNSPDGALYIVDMYRGIIQHKTYLTPYLKNEIKQRSLTQPLAAGRIYKIIPTGKLPAAHSTQINFGTLTDNLNNPNGWIRDRAQQLIVDKKMMNAVPALRINLKDDAQPVKLVHSLWTLSGLNALSVNDVLPLLKNSNYQIKAQAIAVIPDILNKENYPLLLQSLKNLANKSDSIIAPNIAMVVTAFMKFDSASSINILTILGKKYPANKYVADAIISSLKNKEAAFYKIMMGTDPDTSLVINRHLKNIINDIAKAKNNSGADEIIKKYPKGAALFQSVCQTCHGADGNGVTGLAPTLNNSNWVQGNADKLISIVLYGLNGPVDVAGKKYKSPEINGEMPGIGSNKEFTDEDISQVLSFIRNSWSNKASQIDTKTVAGIRNKYRDRTKPFTAVELNK